MHDEAWEQFYEFDRDRSWTRSLSSTAVAETLPLARELDALARRSSS